MKLSLSRDALLTQLQTVSRVASTHSAVQALSGAQIHATADGAEVRATDLEMGLRIPLEATVEREGTVVLPARLLTDVVRSLPDDAVTLEVRSAQQDVELTSGGATFDIRTLRSEDFPPLPEPGGDAVVTVPSAAFVETVQTVAVSASKDETRPVLTGISVSASGSELRMVATDSYRLSVKETKLDAPLDGSFEATVPARALQELARLAPAVNAESLTVSVRENQVVFGAGDAVLSSRLIDGQFPDYRKLVPDAYEHELRIAAPDLLDVVRRISLLAQKNAPLRLSFAEGELTISSQTPDVGEARETIPVAFAGEAFEIGFNPVFLREGLESVEGDEVVVKLISALRPGVLEGGSGEGFSYLIMPIRLNV
jgi:DNA polymerase-3 subunit beta